MNPDSDAIERLSYDTLQQLREAVRANDEAAILRQARELVRLVWPDDTGGARQPVVPCP